jgi:hypothetical protein
VPPADGDFSSDGISAAEFPRLSGRQKLFRGIPKEMDLAAIRKRYCLQHSSKGEPLMAIIDTTLHDIYEELGVLELMESFSTLNFIDQVLGETLIIADATSANSSKREAA